MRKKSKTQKIIVLLAMHLCILLMAISTLTMLLLHRRGIYISEKREAKFCETEGFADIIHHSTEQILEQLQTQKKYDTNTTETHKLIDLDEIYKGQELSYKNPSGLAYNLSDLKQWADTGYSYIGNGYSYSTKKNQDKFKLSDRIIVCLKSNGTYHYYKYSEFMKLLSENPDSIQWDVAHLSALSPSQELEEKERLSKNLQADLLNGQFAPASISDYWISSITVKESSAEEVKYVDFWKYDGLMIQEEYAPEGAKSLLEVVNNNGIWNGRLEDAYNALEIVLFELNNLKDNQYILNGYREGNSNLTYLYGDVFKKTLYSNQKSYTSYGEKEKYIEEMKNMGAYIFLSSSLSECETNLNTKLVEWQGISDQMMKDGTFLVIGVDTTYPVQDYMANSAVNYEKYASYMLPALITAICSVLFFFLGLIWLTVHTGEKGADGQIILNRFDRWYTEIAAGIVFMAWIMAFPLWAESTSYSMSGKTQFIFITTGIYALYSAILFLFGWVSLIRRWKAGVLWKNSLLRWLLVTIKRVWNYFRGYLILCLSDTRYGAKRVGFTVLFLLLQFFLCYLSIRGSTVSLLLVWCIDFIVLYYLRKNIEGKKQIFTGLTRLAEGELDYKINEEALKGEQRELAVYINQIGEGLNAAVADSLRNERMKTELITNVSHDIKTPLTSIINYIDLLKREQIEDPKIQGYLKVLEEKAERLKVLTEDIVEASKASTGNLRLEKTDLNMVELLHQVIGEFEERFNNKNLQLILSLPETALMFHGDGSRIWRVLENLFSNALKYSMSGSRVYVDMKELPDKKLQFTMKNISERPLNISADELTERFIRGDESRNTEGSGLGLSIAKSLVELHNGKLQLELDGDLFKVIITL